MDAHPTTLRGTVRTNEVVLASQKRELVRLATLNQEYTNQIAQYEKAVDTLTARLKTAFDGIEKQNRAINKLFVERDDLVNKYNNNVKDRNAVVANYNDLVAQVEKSQLGKNQRDR